MYLLLVLVRTGCKKSDILLSLQLVTSLTFYGLHHILHDLRIKCKIAYLFEKVSSFSYL